MFCNSAAFPYAAPSHPMLQRKDKYDIHLLSKEEIRFGNRTQSANDALIFILLPRLPFTNTNAAVTNFLMFRPMCNVTLPRTVLINPALATDR